MDNAIGLGIILSLQDKASAGLENIKNSMTALRDVSQDMMKKFDEGAKQMVTGFASMAAGAKVLGALNSTFGVSLTTAVDFEQAMARVGAVSGAVGEDFERLSKQARDLGRDTQFSASQAAASQENLARAGFKTNEIINAMPGLLNMAAAEGMDLANAADIASSAIRGFGLDASEANRVADVLAKTSSASNTSIALLGESLKYVAPLAKGLGVSIEQTNAMLGVMANAGIKGSQAGTSLKGAFQRLSQEPTAVSKALAELGVKAKTSEGDLRPLPEILKDLSAKMANMGKGDKIGVLSNIFGAAASSGMLAVMDSIATGSLPELEDALYGCSGAAKEMADRMNATAQGAMLRLESATEGLRIVIGNHLVPAYTWLIDKMAEFKSWLAQLIEAHPVISKAVIGFTTALIGLSGAALILVGALASVGGFVKMWPLLKVMAVSALSSIRAQARMAMASFSGLGAPVIAMIALAGALYLAWRKNLWGIRDMVTAVTEGFKMAFSAGTDGITEIDEELANKLKAAGIWDFAVTMGQVFFRVRQFWEGLVEGFKEGLGYIRAAFDWLKGLFAPVVESGQELLKFLGILKPIAETQSSTWKSWGQIIGRIAPVIIGVIAAFKGFSVVVGIVKAITGAVGLLNSVILANPIMAIAAVMVAAGIYIYAHWEEISEWFAGFWDNIGGYAQAAADWVMQKWQAISDWWNSWKLADVFAPVMRFAQRAWSYVKQKWEDFKAWWGSWSITDIFASVMRFAQNAQAYVIQKWEDFKAWWNSWSLTDIFPSVGEYADEAKDFIITKWEGLKDWWDSWTLTDVFSSVKDYATEAWSYVSQKWQEFGAWWDSWSLSDIFPSIEKYADTAKGYVIQKWEDVKTWWDSWTFSDVFAQVKDYATKAWSYVSQKWQEFGAWWDSWTFSDVFAPVKDYASEAWSYISQKWQEFGTWWDSWSLKDIFPESFSFSWDNVASGLTSAKDIISSGWQSLTESLTLDNLSSVWQGLTSGFESARDLLLSGWNNLTGMLNINFSGFWDSLASGFSTVCDGIKGAWNGVTGFIKDTWNSASSYVSGAWDWTKGLFGFGPDEKAVNQEQLKAQVNDITVLNKMSESFSQRVAEMTTAWQPFKASLGEGFEQIYTVMQSVADKINTTVIPAVNNLVSALGGVARELSAVAQAGNLDIQVGAAQPALGNNVPAQYKRMAGGRNKSNVPAYAAGGIITQPHLGLVGEAGREAIIPLEDKSNGLPLIMSAINELGVGNSDILPYLNAVEPEIASPSVNISTPAQATPVVNVPTLEQSSPTDISGIERTVEAILASFSNLASSIEQPNISPQVENIISIPAVSVSPIVSPADVNVQPPSISTAPLDITGFSNAINGLANSLNNEDTSIKLVAPQSQAPSSPLLIQHAQNQAVMNGQAQVQAQEQSPERPVSVNSHVDVTIEGKPVELYIDGEKVGSAVLRWSERQTTRSGVSEF